MRKLFLLMIIIVFTVTPVCAMEIQPPDVPDEGEIYMPEDTESFSEAIWYVICSAFKHLAPDLANTIKSCFSLVLIMILLTVAQSISEKTGSAIHLIGTLMIGILLLSPSKTLIQDGVDSINEMTEYSKLLVPVLTSALAAQGGTTSSAALYAGSAFFSTVLSTLIMKISIPLQYIFLCLSLSKAAFPNDMLNNIHKFIKWFITWSIRIILYVFIGYMSITGVVSGTADASAVRAVKLSLNGMIPVVGNILSEASETILVSAGIMKNAAGIYGAVVIMTLVVAPILKIGAQYLMLNITCAVGEVLGAKKQIALLKDFSGGMGMLLGMTGTVCLLILISTVCFMKGMA